MEYIHRKLPPVQNVTCKFLLRPIGGNSRKGSDLQRTAELTHVWLLSQITVFAQENCND